MNRLLKVAVLTLFHTARHYTRLLTVPQANPSRCQGGIAAVPAGAGSILQQMFRRPSTVFMYRTITEWHFTDGPRRRSATVVTIPRNASIMRGRTCHVTYVPRHLEGASAVEGRGGRKASTAMFILRSDLGEARRGECE